MHVTSRTTTGYRPLCFLRRFRALQSTSLLRCSALRTCTWLLETRTCLGTCVHDNRIYFPALVHRMTGSTWAGPRSTHVHVTARITSRRTPLFLKHFRAPIEHSDTWPAACPQEHEAFRKLAACFTRGHSGACARENQKYLRDLVHRMTESFTWLGPLYSRCTCM